MKKLTSFLLMLLTLAALGYATTGYMKPELVHAASAYQVFMSTRLAGTTGSTGFLAIGFPKQFGCSSNSPQQCGTMSTGGTISELHAYESVPPSGASTWTITVYQNGSPTSITCTINSSSPTDGNGAAYCSDTSHTLTVAAGDVVYVQYAAGSAPTASQPYVTARFTPTTVGETQFFPTANNNAVSNSVTNYFPGAGANTPAATEAWPQVSMIPEAGMLKDLSLTGSPLSSGNYVITLNNFTSSSATSITCTQTSSACSDMTHTASVAAGDLVDISTAPNSPSSSDFIGGGIVFVPSTAGNFDLISTAANATFSNNAYYIPLTLSGDNLQTTEASAHTYADAMTIKSISVALSTASGSGKSHTFTLVQNGSDTACSVTISDSNTSGSATCNVLVAQGDLLATHITASGGPASTYLAVGYVATTVSGGGGGGAGTTNSQFSISGGLFRIFGGLFRIQ